MRDKTDDAQTYDERTESSARIKRAARALRDETDDAQTDGEQTESKARKVRDMRDTRTQNDRRPDGAQTARRMQCARHARQN